ncbi:uncharacterized protein G2W53_018294 [Senna tora]|uniref:Uncharacterized protein n=1 Tax=Senna tora TaxID=362788 RepID=A0A834TRJ2_9FABA|nr:uncharacterized protein G2W53_018294 [Senna tora]
MARRGGSAVAMGGGANIGDKRGMEQENGEKKRRQMCWTVGDNFAQKAPPLNGIHKIILGFVVVVQALPQAVDATVLRVPRRCSNFEASVSGVRWSRVFAAVSIAGGLSAYNDLQSNNFRPLGMY